jgi:hypothetical protein
MSMKKFLLSTATLLFLTQISMAAFAADPQKAPEPMPGMKMHHGMGMMGGMTDEKLQGMQEHMLMLHDLSNQILAEKDSAKKQALKKQQLDMMKAHHSEMMQKHQKMMK